MCHFILKNSYRYFKFLVFSQDFTVYVLPSKPNFRPFFVRKLSTFGNRLLMVRRRPEINYYSKLSTYASSIKKNRKNEKFSKLTKCVNLKFEMSIGVPCSPFLTSSWIYHQKSYKIYHFYSALISFHFFMGNFVGSDL